MVRSQTDNHSLSSFPHHHNHLLLLRLLEQQLQAWRVTVQSEQGILEDRCSELEVTMETLRKHNVYLQDMLKQVDTHIKETEGA